MLSYNHVFSLISLIFLFSIPLIIFIKDARRDMEKDTVID
jgi:hypothetical protein